MAKEEIIYVLTNPVMPNLVMIGKDGPDKIGETEEFRKYMPKFKRHIQGLHSSPGVPVPFEVYYACKVNKDDDVKEKVKRKFKNAKIDTNRKFYRVNPERVFLFLKPFATEDVTPHDDCVEKGSKDNKDYIKYTKKYKDNRDSEEQRTLNNARDMRPVFRFSSLGIPIGSTLTFIRDKTITVKVVDDLNVQFKGEVTSLSDAALKTLNNEFRKTWVTTWSPPLIGEEYLPWGPVPTGPSPWGPNYWIYEKESLSERQVRMEFDDDGKRSTVFRLLNL